MVSITGSNVWMTDYEITDLLGVTSSAVCNHVKSIFKSGVLADAYNMEMITALAFRLNSLPAKIFREWVVKKAVTPTRSAQHIVLQIGNGFPC